MAVSTSGIAGLSLLVAALVFAHGCTADGQDRQQSAAQAPQSVKVFDLQFTIPADWHILVIGGTLTSQDSVAGLMGSVPLHDPCTQRGCQGTPYNLMDGGVGVRIVRSGNFGLRELPPGEGYSPTTISGMPAVLRVSVTPDPQTKADQTLEWVIKPPVGDLIRIIGQIAGDTSQRRILEEVVDSLRLLDAGTIPTSRPMPAD